MTFAIDKNKKVFLAGHKGMLGSAIHKLLLAGGYTNIITKTRQEVDLLNQAAVYEFFASEKPDYVILSAAKVGGIKASITYPTEFLFENLEIQNNVIGAAHKYNVEKLLFLGSSCIYPRMSPQPMKEEYLLDGKPEPLNEGYAIAKIAGIKLCEVMRDQYQRNFVSCMPTNIYGPGDNFSLETSHVIPALIRRMNKAKIDNTPEVVIRGSGISKREFLYVDDLASAIMHIFEHYNERQFLNVGTGEEISIKDLAFLIKDIVGYTGELVFDTTKPDGMPNKLCDVTKLHNTGRKHSIGVREGIEKTYAWFLETYKE